MYKKALTLFFGITISLCALAQKKPSSTDPALDTVDYDVLFSELDDFLDSLLAPRSYLTVNVGFGTNFFDFTSRTSNKLNTERRLHLTPTLGYFDKSGFGINLSANVLKEAERLNPYQLITTVSYDYVKNLNFITGVAATHYFTKDSLDFYTSPLKNEVYAYFSYRDFWLKPTISASYGWGSRTAYEEREEYITPLRLKKRGYTRVSIQESISDFNVMLALRHDFYWLDVLTKNDFVRLTPQLSFTGGTQNFGFNQTTNTYRSNLINGKNQLYRSENLTLDDQTKFQPLSVAAAIKTDFSIGKYFLQPQVVFNYYIPAPNKNLSTLFNVNTGFSF